MKPLHQTIFGGDNGDSTARGNCFAACIASILELPLEAVPNFCDHDDWRHHVNEWLQPRGLFYVDFRLDDGSWRIEHAVQYAGYHVISGPAERGLRHAVVGYKGNAVHDPHPSGAMLLEDQEFGFLVPTLETPVVVKRANWQSEQPPASLAALVKAKRDRERLSLRDVTAATGVSASTLSRIENTPSLSPDLDTAARLAYWLGVGFDVFVRPYHETGCDVPAHGGSIASMLEARLLADASLNPAMVKGLVGFFQAAYDVARRAS